MRALKEIRKLLFLGLAAAVFLAIAPIQNLKAGYYSHTEYWNSYHDCESSDPAEGVTLDGGTYEYADSDQADSSASAYVQIWVGDGSGWVYCDSTAYTDDKWTWTGGGTPTGGTLSYDYYINGHASVQGFAYEYSPEGAASASSEAYSSASGRGGGAHGDAEGGCSGWGTAWVDGGVSPSEAGYFDGDTTTLTYDAWYPYGAVWSLSIDDSEEISEGTSYVDFYVMGYSTSYVSASATYPGGPSWAEAASAASASVYDVDFP